MDLKGMRCCCGAEMKGVLLREGCCCCDLAAVGVGDAEARVVLANSSLHCECAFPRKVKECAT